MSTPLESIETNTSLLSSSSSFGGGEGIEVKVVVTIRKKIIDKVEDQWEYFINDVGQRI